MKNLLKVALVAILCVCSSQAFAGVFDKGDALGSVTLGVGNGFSQKFAFDYGVADGWINGRASLGVGAAIGNNIWFNGHGDDISIMPTCSFHYQFVDNLDTYALMGLGAKIAFHEGGHVSGHFTGEGVLGVRYFFNNAIAINGEVGYTCGSYIAVGISWRF